MKKLNENDPVSLEDLNETSKRAINSNMLEGILPDVALVEDLRQLDSGAISLQEMKEKGIARIIGTTQAGKNHEQNNSCKASPDIYEGVDLSGLSPASRYAMVTHILEGMIPDPELIATLRLVDAGEIDLEEFMRRENARIDAKYPEEQ